MSRKVSIADATLASPQRLFAVFSVLFDVVGFNRRRDACFPATTFRITLLSTTPVSIADATLASPQPAEKASALSLPYCFNRRRDACFPATQYAPPHRPRR